MTKIYQDRFIFIKISTLSLLMFVISSCHVFDDKEDSEEAQKATVERISIKPGPVSQPGSPSTNIDIIPQEGASTGYLLTPEQHSASLFETLRVKLGYEDELHNRFVDFITEHLAVPLGGVDFRTSSIRDRFPKVQTQLIIRQLAWNAASIVVWRETDPDHPDPVHIFEKCNISEDRPRLPEEQTLSGREKIHAEAREQRWVDQLTEFYWRILVRPPSVEEIALHKQAFLNAISHYHGWPPAGWNVVLFALLSGAEYWNL